MDDYLIDGEILTDIADKIREKAPDTYGGSTVTPEEMPEAVEDVWQAGYSMGGGAVDLSPYQTKHDENLNTNSKEIVEAINELNEKIGDGAIDGKDGEDGKTPYIQDGYWYIDGTNTNVKAQGEQGYSIVASVSRSFTTANWDTYGTVGHVENWAGTSCTGVKVGDLFLIVGTATDTGIGHMLVYQHTAEKNNYQLNGKCIAHHIISAKGKDGKDGTDYILTEADKEEIAGIVANNISNKVTDLTGTTWVLNNSITLTNAFTYNLTFNSNNGVFTQFRGVVSGVVSFLYYDTTAVYQAVATSVSWADGYKVVSITGGTDATNSNAIDTLYAIGTLQEPEYQPKHDKNLNTESKDIVGAINEVNGKTVDKIKSIDTYADGVSDLDTGDGIAWREMFAFNDGEDLSGKAIAFGNIYHRVPILSGNGIKFTYSDDNQFVKINATGGGSADESTIGTWRFNEVPSFDGVVYGVSYPANFTTLGNDATCYSIIIESNKYGASGNFISYEYEGGSATAYSSVPVVWFTGGWDGDGYRTITIKDELEDGWFKTWLKANAVKQADTPKPCFEMPQIRFTSANGYNDGQTPNLYVDGDKPLKLTVEIVGGGALQVGDALQVCHRKRFNGSQANGYKRKYKLQRFAEYIVTEEDLNNKYLTVSVACGRGGTSPQVKHAFRGLFHDGMANNIAPLYLRIRRAKGDMQNNDSGQTVDAEFSNIVTIWKHSHRVYQTIRIQ